VFLDGQHFAKLVIALAADVFVKGHRVVRFVIEGLGVDEKIFEKCPIFPALCQGFIVICPAVLLPPLDAVHHDSGD